jgi:hypothetical protein
VPHVKAFFIPVFVSSSTKFLPGPTATTLPLVCMTFVPCPIAGPSQAVPATAAHARTPISKNTKKAAAMRVKAIVIIPQKYDSASKREYGSSSISTLTWTEKVHSDAYLLHMLLYIRLFRFQAVP